MPTPQTSLCLKSLHPGLISAIEIVLGIMESKGHPMIMIQGVRSVAQQQALYAKGRTAPGKIVTQCDGLIKKSRHQIALDGYGHAVDCCFRGPDPFGIKQPWALFGQTVKSCHLVWGGDFRSPIDLDHAELPS